MIEMDGIVHLYHFLADRMLERALACEFT